MSYLNVRSLKEHCLDLQNYKVAEISDIFCSSETKVHDCPNYPFDKMKCIYSKCKHGSVIYSNHDDVEIFSLNTTILETVSVVIKETSIVSVYVTPATLWTLIADYIKKMWLKVWLDK